jgi:hypothetical protein
MSEHLNSPAEAPALQIPAQRPPQNELIDAVLHGGPSHMPAELRSQRMAGDTEKIKIEHYGGYEHFQRVEDSPAGQTAVKFRWSGRTRIAE